MTLNIQHVGEASNMTQCVLVRSIKCKDDFCCFHENSQDTLKQLISYIKYQKNIMRSPPILWHLILENNWNKWTYIGGNNALGPNHTVMHYVTSKMPGKEQSNQIKSNNGNQIMEKAVQLPCLSLKSWEYFYSDVRLKTAWNTQRSAQERSERQVHHTIGKG